MGILQNLVNAFTSPQERSGMPTALLPANRALSGSSVTVGEAMTLPAVYRAISILNTTVKQMAIEVVREDRVVSSPSFIKQPNPLTSRATFLEQTIVSLATQGNAYWLIQRSGSGAIAGLLPLNPLDMQLETDLSGRLVRYQYQGINYSPAEIKHIPLLLVPGSLLGLGPIQAASQDLEGAIELRDYASQWFEKAGVPSGVLKTDQFVTDDQVGQAKDAWNATAGAKNGVAVMGNGWSYMPVYLKPEELQFLANQNFSVQQVARIFGVPATLMLTSPEGSSMTYANVSQEWLAFIRFTVMQYLVSIEDALSDFLPNTQRAKFNVETILRPDTQTRYESYKLALEAGWLTVDEVRAIEDLPPIPSDTSVAPQPVIQEVIVDDVEGDANNV